MYLVGLQPGKMWTLRQKNVPSVNIPGPTSCKFRPDLLMNL